MSDFSIKFNSVCSQSDDMKSYVTILGNVINDVESVQNSLEAKKVYLRIQNIIEALYTEREQMIILQTKLNNIVEIYNKTELKIMDNAKKSIIFYDMAAGASAAARVAGNGNNTKDEEDNSISKTILKTLLDVITKAGSIGQSSSLIMELLKSAIDGDGITLSDIGKFIEGGGNSTVGILELIEDCKGKKWSKIVGLDDDERIKIDKDSKAGWFQKMKTNASNTFKASLKKELSVFETDATSGAKKIDGGKAAGWAFKFIANGFSNAEEYQNGEISGGRAVAETISETLIDIGKDALITAGIATGLAAIGFGAPVIVVGGVATIVSVGLDWVCEQFTGKSVTENISDGLLDGLTKIGENLTGAISNVGNAVSSWWNKVQLAW